MKPRGSIGFWSLLIPLHRLHPLSSRRTRSRLRAQSTALLCAWSTILLGVPLPAAAATTPARSGGAGILDVTHETGNDTSMRASRGATSVRAHPGPHHQPELSFSASNGFVVTARRQDGYTVFRATSPWNESLELFLRTLRSGAVELRVGQTTLRSRLSPRDGSVQTVEVASPGGRAIQKGAQRQVAELQGRGSGAADVSLLDLQAYDLFLASASAAASRDFWEGLAAAFAEFEAEVPATIPAGCTFQGFRCFASLTLWAGSVGSLVALCGGTLGAACIGAILAHEGTSALALAECAAWLACMAE